MRTRARRGRGPGGAGRPGAHPGLLALALVSILSGTLAHAAHTLSMHDGSLLTALDACGDADDLFVDSKRGRVYVTCGEGLIEVFARRGDAYESIGRVPTVSGARTSLLVTDADRLYVAVRASGSEPAAIWALRPLP